MGLRIFTWVHVAISLAAIGAGIVVVCGLINSQPLDGWTLFFLITTALTSLTGFGFPFERFLPSHALGIIALVVLVPTVLGRYTFHLEGAWRWIYVVGAVISLYLNVFVLIVQSFQKVPALKATAPTQKEPPFAIAQLVTLVAFVAITVVACMQFHP